METLADMQTYLASLPAEHYEPIAACMKEMAALADRYEHRHAVVAMMVLGMMLTEDLEKKDPGGNLL
jgi:hypothetical protein